MLTIPAAAIPSQKFTVSLAGQSCAISLYQKEPGLFMDVAVDNRPIISGVICLDRVKMIRQTYLGFVGDLVFFDTQGKTDPFYTELGLRYQLAWISPEEM